MIWIVFFAEHLLPGILCSCTHSIEPGHDVISLLTQVVCDLHTVAPAMLAPRLMIEISGILGVTFQHGAVLPGIVVVVTSDVKAIMYHTHIDVLYDIGDVTDLAAPSV
jgi:hypothetical protein